MVTSLRKFIVASTGSETLSCSCSRRSPPVALSLLSLSMLDRLTQADQMNNTSNRPPRTPSEHVAQLGGQARATPYVQFAVDLGEVLLDRTHGDEQPVGDLPVGGP